MSRSPAIPRTILAGLAGATVFALATPALATAAPSAAAARMALAGLRSPCPARGAGLPRRAVDAGPHSPSHSPELSPASDPEGQVYAANHAARVEPGDTGFDDASQRYAYREGALFQVYASPGQVTDIALQEGETLVGPGPVAAGDTARWMIGDTLSGAGASRRVHILLKPTRADIATNLVINTDRRTYHLELHASARTYMASVSWTYPEDELVALRRAEADAAQAAPIADGFTVEKLDFGYRIAGDRPRWRPLRVFDDGRRTLVEFPPDIGQGDMPPFFVIGADGEAELANYRVNGRYLIVDRLFRHAELRLGAGRRQQRVRIIKRGASGS